VQLLPSEPGVTVDFVHIIALSSDSPANAEGAADTRQLSLCVTGAKFQFLG
jgi:hypothetical protein